MVAAVAEDKADHSLEDVEASMEAATALWEAAIMVWVVGTNLQ